MADILHSIVTRIDTTANWTTLNPTPANGEQCIEILGRGLFKLKVGDGVTPWLALNYATVNGDVSGLKALLKKEIEERKEGDQHLQELLDQLDDKKLDKVVDTPDIIYGTDSKGNQTTYNKESFGQVDDVQLNGVSVVENKIANLEPEAADIAYTNDQYPTMQTLQDAMDKLLYINPVINSFGGGNMYEIGSSISSVTFTWSVNKKMTTLNINQGVGSVLEKTSPYVYIPENPITSDITYTMTASDGVNAASPKSTTLSFCPRRYWGVTTTETLSDEQLYALSNQVSNTRAQDRDFDCSGSENGKFWWIVIPKKYCNNIQFYDMNSGNPASMTLPPECITSRTITNSYGVSYEVNVYRAATREKAASNKIRVA